MFMVEGYIDGVSYAVQVDGDPAADPAGRLERAGKALGTARAISLLLRHEGLPVDVTPVGPTVIASVDDPLAVLAVLHAHTEVTAVTGDAPPLLPTPGDGVVH